MIMRITDQEKAAFIDVIAGYLKDTSAELRLHGSRVNDNLKGGDIDLLLITDDASIEANIKTKKPYLLSEIKEKIGDQKIDLAITNYEKIKNDPLLKHMLETSILLQQW